MTLFSVLQRLLLAVPLVLWLNACSPMSNPEDDEKDPHYLLGMSRMSSMNYDGAIEAFESALTANPKNAAAHGELGFLYEERKQDFAAAIYHFQKHLELRPKSNVAEPIKQHIMACKQELARTVSFTLVSRQMQDEFRKLNSTNALLNELVKQLRVEMADQATAFSNKLAAVSQAAAAQAQSRSESHALSEPDRRPAQEERPPASSGSNTPSRPAVVPRSYVVRSGDTLASIARKYNIKLPALQAANPRVDARRLKAGQILNLPSGHEER